ncbi:caspase family protein [Sorangium sp. So ce131]|uniref:caspase family protein n=1 Tax=Sorangium sp. So ce131 TaxID=3133282 RepID=UPI003F630DA5
MIAALPPVLTGKLPSGARLLAPEGHVDPVQCLSFSPDGRRLLSGGGRLLLIWDVESGRVVQRLEESSKVFACAFLPDGRQVASGTHKGKVSVWDTVIGERRPVADLGAKAIVVELAARPDGHELMVGTSQGDVWAWSVETRRETFHDQIEGQVVSVGYLDDGQRFGGAYDGSTFVWGPKGSRRMTDKAGPGSALGGERLLLNVSGTRIVIADADGSVRPLFHARHHVERLAVNSRRDLVVIGEETGNVSVWTVPGGTLRCQFPGRGSINAVAFDPTGEHFTWTGDDGGVMIARTATCEDPSSEVTFRRFGSGKRSLSSVAAAGHSVILSDYWGQVSTWSSTSLRMDMTAQLIHTTTFTLDALADGRWIAGGVGDADGIFLGSASGIRRLDLGRRILPVQIGRFEDEAAILVLGPESLIQVPLDRGPPTELLRDSMKRYGYRAFAVRPGGKEAVVGGSFPDLYKIALPPRGDPTVWPRHNHAASSVQALAYDPDGRWLAEAGDYIGIVLRRADTGDIVRRIPAAAPNLEDFLLTREHLWTVAPSLTELLRWPLAGNSSPDLPPIDEGARIADLTATPDGRTLVVALEDGRAAVRALPDGRLIAHLIPLHDGSWATLYADGRYEASSGDATSLAFESPEAKCRLTLDGKGTCIAFSGVTQTSLATGAVLISTTVFSPSGPPTIVLDGRWPVRSVIPSSTAPGKYNVELLLDDPDGVPHTLEARTERGDAAHVDIRLDLDPRHAPAGARALVIGNDAYSDGARLQGAVKDAKDFADVLRSETSWHLRDIEPLFNQPAASFKDTVLRFFQDAKRGETLLFYFAGHGLTDKGEGYLLPIDYQPGALRSALSARELWEAIRASSAARILVVLDACRTGSFVLPESVGLEAERLSGRQEGKRVGLIAATSSASFGSSTADTTSGGVFTQQLLGALRSTAHANPLTGAVTARAAKFAAEAYFIRNNLPQRPGIYGELDPLPLTWPVGERISKPVAAAGGGRGKRIAIARWDVVKSRQVTVDGSRVEGSSTLVIGLTFGHDTESVRVGVHYPFGDPAAPARPELFTRKPEGNRDVWSRGEAWEIHIPLIGLEPKSRYRVEVQPCDKGGKCGDQSPESFALDL